MPKKLSVVVSGSFCRSFEGISETVRAFESLGVEVLSPKASKVINPGEEFAVLETDDTSDPQTLEQRHLDAITAADALYLYDPEGYIGDSSKMELGWAIALGKPVFCKELVADSTLKFFCGDVATPEQVKDALDNLSPLESINERSSVAVLQRYIHEMVVRRGFDKETPRDVLLLMVEEVGELAKALRKYLGLKSDQERQNRYPALEGELADVFIYLLDLSSLLQISLFHALHTKEQENEKRSWG
ncbi:MAG: MazG nucleotide pyrophosphohydrolase domain-containing protein [bacterium]|nr:MazG nucleotide pyrophosphohydrolase domain-containing protein [bacterium]